MNFLNDTKPDCYIIAEIANAAQGIYEDNLKLIQVAREGDADAVKFQFYKYDVLATPSYMKYEIFKRTFYTFEQRTQFIKEGSDTGLDVWVDVFDRWGLDVVKANLDEITALKIPPAIFLDERLVQDTLSLGLPTAIGVGGYNDENIDYVLRLVGKTKAPLLLMYGFQGFPTPEEDTAIARIPHLKKKYGFPVGFADHVDASSDLAFRMPQYSYFAGARVIEKHITLDRGPKGLDYFSSLEPGEFKQFVDRMRRCEAIYGDIELTSTQLDYLKHSTRATTTSAVKSGAVICTVDVAFKRTGKEKALFPNEIGGMLPALARRDFKVLEGIAGDELQPLNTGIVVVCRLNSSRLKRKALLDLNGTPVIERCLLNCLASRYVKGVVLATSDLEEDSELADYRLDGRVPFFQGSAEDPAARMLGAAKMHGFEHIVRVTGDSPLISSELIDHIVRSHIEAQAEYSCLKDAPLGAKPEVISVKAIKRILDNAQTEGVSEYLSLYFRNNPNRFIINEVATPEEFRRPEYRLNLDYEEDYELQQRIFKALNPGRTPVKLKDVLNLLDLFPDIVKINAHIKPRYLEGDLVRELQTKTKLK